MASLLYFPTRLFLFNPIFWVFTESEVNQKRPIQPDTTPVCPERFCRSQTKVGEHQQLPGTLVPESRQLARKSRRRRLQDPLPSDSCCAPRCGCSAASINLHRKTHIVPSMISHHCACVFVRKTWSACLQFPNDLCICAKVPHRDLLPTTAHRTGLNGAY